MRTTVVAIVSLLGLLASVAAACGGSTASESTALRGDRQAAREFLQLSARYAERVPDLAARADSIVQQELDRCEAVYVREPVAVRSGIIVMSSFHGQFIQPTVLLPNYQMLVKRIATVRTTNRVLRRLVRNAQFLLRQAERFATVDTDFWSFLEGWKRAKWNERFLRQYSDATYKRAGVDARLVRQRREQIYADATRLRALGLSRSQGRIVGLALGLPFL